MTYTSKFFLLCAHVGLNAQFPLLSCTNVYRSKSHRRRGSSKCSRGNGKCNFLLVQAFAQF